MRKTFAAGMIAALLALAVPQVSHAFCAQYAAVGSARGRSTIRAERFVVWGVIERTPPKDAHGRYSFYLKVNRAYVGKAPGRMLITDYGDFQFKADPKAPGGSSAGTAAFLKKFGGQQAVVSAAVESSPFKNQFQTSTCKYNAYGNAAASSFRKQLYSMFDAKPAKAAASAAPAPVVSKPVSKPAPEASKPVASSSRTGVILKAMLLLGLVGGGIALFGRGKLYGRTA